MKGQSWHFDRSVVFLCHSINTVVSFIQFFALKSSPFIMSRMNVNVVKLLNRTGNMAAFGTRWKKRRFYLVTFKYLYSITVRNYSTLLLFYWNHVLSRFKAHQVKMIRMLWKMTIQTKPNQYWAEGLFTNCWKHSHWTKEAQKSFYSSLQSIALPFSSCG